MVDGLERDLGDTAKVIRLDVFTPLGQQMAARYSVRGVPTFVVLDGEGNVYKVSGGIPDVGSLKAAVDEVRR
jgi:thioredoxin-related protein